jgi:hypothetical protein
VRGNEIAKRLAKDGSVQKSVGPEPSFKKLKRLVDNQRLVMSRGPSSTQRQAQKLVSGCNSTTKTRLLTFNRTQSRVVIDLTGHNTLRRRSLSKRVE